MHEDGSESILLVLIWSVLSLLGTRFFLQLVGFPKLGGGDWHVAHTLFGGVAMTIGMALVLAYKGFGARKWGATIFGIGLGWFVDEIGKFLSTDNDYFFEPAISLAYAFFIILFLFYRFVKHRDKVPVETNSRFLKLFARLKSLTYHRVFKKKLTLNILVIIAVIYAVGGFWDLLTIGVGYGVMMMLKIGSDILTSLLFLIGIYWAWGKKRRKGLMFFQYGLLVNIFLGQVFKFYFEQFSAVFGLTSSIIIYFGLERLRKERVI